MKRVILVFAICIMLLSATPAFAATLNFDAPGEITVTNGQAILPIEVKGGNQGYSVLQFQIVLPDNVTITDISYSPAKNYTVQAPHQPSDSSTDYAGVTMFGIFIDGNGIQGDVTCTLKLSYTGTTNQTITIKEIKQAIIPAKGVSVDNISKSSTVVLKASSTPSDPDVVLYNISTDSVSGGKITVSTPNTRPSNQAAENDTVSISFGANSGYTFKNWTVSGANGQSVTVNNVNSATTSFRMPAFDVRVSANAPEDGTGTGTGTSTSGGSGSSTPTTVTITDLDVPTGSIRFSDVTDSHWAYEFIEYLAGLGFVNGKTATTFGPSDNITRAEFVTILARMSGDTLPTYSGTFSDVDASAYYAQAVAWAVQAGVTQGTSDTTFSPNNRITRQDIATMLVRYANYKNIVFAPINAAVTFSDDAQISGYAKEAVTTMQRAGIISGNTDGTFRPLNNATRAEASKMLALVHHAMNK